MSVVREMGTLLSLVLYSILGSILGFLFGMIPGFHPNLLGRFLIENPLKTAFFLVSLGTAYNFSQAILACGGFKVYGFILAGRDEKRIVMQGVKYSLIMLACFPVFYILKITEKLDWLVPSILLLSSLHIISKERYPNVALLIFVLSGIIGYLVLRFHLCKNPLLPLFSGLFGVPSLLSRKSPETEKGDARVCTVLLASLFMVSFPSLSPTQASIIIGDLFKESSQSLIAALNFSQTLVSLYSWFFIGKPREGYLNILRALPKTCLPLLLLSFLLSTAMGSFLFFISRRIRIRKDLRLLAVSLNILTILYFSGVQGIIVYVASLLLGLECLRRSVSLLNCMGVLVVPTLLWYL